MRIQVILRGGLAADGEPQHRLTVKLPWGATIEALLKELSIPSVSVQMAMVNGRPVSRTVTLCEGDSVILAGAG